MNSLVLIDQGFHSETRKNGWMILCASISSETKIAHKISSSESTLNIPIKIYL